MLGHELQQQCLNLRTLAREGEQWLADNSAVVSNSVALREKVRRVGRRLKNYAEAAGRKMGVAVFGPSQAGKSTLISALAKGPGGSLKAVFGEWSLDFMLQVNPEGGDETTGLVTRFSLDPAPESPDRHHPVCLQLFSEMDIVKILTNTYFAEAKGVALLTEEEMIETLEKLASRPAVKNNLNLDDLEDLAEYVKTLAPDSESAYGRLLSTTYWSRALPLGVRLGLEDRAELFSILWGRLGPMTEVYKRLYQVLESLNFAETAFCELAALYSETSGRKFTVLQVKQLDGLLGDSKPAEAGPPVSVITPQGLKVTLPRPLLSALIAEIHVEVKEKPGQFMEKADVLDFPGYRAREKMDDIIKGIENPNTLKICFLRGKVAYLFERYCSRKEISSMLLCVAESVQNNPDLPHVINRWLDDTHGRTPAERGGRPVSLFMVLTKFDRLMEQGAGSTDTAERWENRLNASFINFFGLQSWPREWALENGRPTPFNNLYWLLNLNYGHTFLNIEEIDADQGLYRANGVRPEQVEWLKSVRDGYLRAPKVSNHIRDPQASWDAVVNSHDGGVDYIIRNLTPVLTDDLKTDQLSALALLEAKSLDETLRPFYHGGGLEEERAVKEQKSLKIIKALKKALTRQRFGELLKDLQLSDDDCRSVYGLPLPNDDLIPDEEEDVLLAVGNSAVSDDDDDEDSRDLTAVLFGRPEPGSGESDAKPVRRQYTNDAARRFRRRIELTWHERLVGLASNSRRQRYYALPEELFQILADELSQAAKRLKVLDQVEDRMRLASGYSNDNPERVVWKQSRLAAAELASFINWLGLSPVKFDRAARTVSIQGRSMTLFEPPRPPAGELPVLPDIQADDGLLYFQDWAMALWRLMIQNVDFSEKTYDLEENVRLGGIISGLDKTRKALS